MSHLDARHYRTRQPIRLRLEGGRIAAVEPAEALPDAPFVAPGLFDLQVNGALGHAFVCPSLDQGAVRAVADECWRHGITGFCPTLITASETDLLHGFGVLRQARQADPLLARALPCFHLEGPWISPEDGPRGAHPSAHVRPPCLREFDRLQQAAGGLIRLVTLAPERPGALAFIAGLARRGVVAALGHTAASGDLIRRAADAGARLSTHLGNGCASVLPRHDNPLWEQLAEDRLAASVIADGHHLPQAVLRCVLRCKTPARVVLTCDASSLAGLPPGRYPMWGKEIEVQPGGKVVVPGTPYLAGSGVFLDECVARLAALGERPLADCLEMASARPRDLLGLPGGTLEVGQPADLTLYQEPFRVVGTILAGQRVGRADDARPLPYNAP